MEVGQRGEDLACRLLKKNHYKVLERNVRGHYGEIDIVARQRDCIVFVEVRTRTSQEYGTPEESVTARKRAKLVACAQDYIATHERYRDTAWRIDVVGIELDEEGRETRADITENAVPID